MRTRLLISAIAILTVSAFAVAQTPPPTGGAGQARPPGQGGQRPAQGPKPYNEVVTKEAETQHGVFKVHKIDEKILWEIPANMLGRLFLWQTEIAEQPYTTGYPGTAAGLKTICFTRRNNKIFMHDVSDPIRTDETSGGLFRGVQMNTVYPIIMAFDVQAEGENNSTVIDVTSTFLTDPQDFGVRGAVGGAGVDGSRSYIDRVKAFPINIETRSLLTFARGGGGRQASPFGPPAGGNSSAVTVLVHYSLTLLPEKPMMGRLKDSRIGYFTVGFDSINTNKPVKPIEYIARFRLEKKDPKAAESEPVKPIVFYLSREVPEKWRSYMKRGVEMWQPAFAKAGFKNAIICKDAPSVEADPTWDPEDARYSVIRWAPSSTANAMGPSIQDPRSGETISAHIIFWHNIIDLTQKWYFVQCGAIDPRTRRLPFSDDMIGETLTYVVAHEVGHTLGLEHNFKASVARTIAQLRNKEFMKTHGVSSSIMSYSRNNYVAQPGDGITYSTNGFLGEYDFFAIEYGYKPIPDVNKPEDETSFLDRFLARQVDDPTVRFGNYKYRQDPTTQSERIGDDAVEATRLGLLNLERTAQRLLTATTTHGEDYTLMSEVLGDINSHRMMWLMQVVQYVGGVVETDYHAGRGGEVFKPVSAAYQRKAVNFLTTTGLQTPMYLLQSSILGRIEPNGVVNRVSGVQNLILNQLLNDARARRMFDAEAQLGQSAYRVSEMCAQLREGSWSELREAKPRIDIYRRNLQRTYLSTIDGRLNGASKTQTDLRLYLKIELKNLAKQIDKAIPVSADQITAMHLADSRKEIERIIQGKTSQAVSTGTPSFADLFGISEHEINGHTCFGPGAMAWELMHRIEK
ncbi:MAG: zinc-dependent metalloprotease [Fimbriimonadaceae bacterium]|nr:zinc-dependent metalloprotease [Fimbriimonadaceae bacterium]